LLGWLSACTPDIEGNQPGECSDGADNDSDTYFANNVSGLGIDFHIAESISAQTHFFTYRLFIAGLQVYEQLLEFDVDYVAGDLVSWNFTQPVSVYGGKNIRAGVFLTDKETREVGRAVQVFPTSDPLKRYFKLRRRSFNDRDVVFKDEIQAAVKVYDIYCDSAHTGDIPSDGSPMYPYTDIATAISASSPNDTIFLNGDFVITSKIVLPHGLIFEGVLGKTTVKYETFSNTNDDVFYHDGDNTHEFIFRNINPQNGAYGLQIKKPKSLELDRVDPSKNGWSGVPDLEGWGSAGHRLNCPLCSRVHNLCRR
jgi:hypothetical protein